MAATFFRNLVTLEDEIINLKSEKTFSEDTRELLINLIEVVEENNFIADKNKLSKFLCSNFRLNLTQQLELWNSLGGSAKNSNSIRSAKSRVSDSLYGLFGDGFYHSFMSEDKEGLDEIRLVISALGNKDYLFAFLITEGVDKLIPKKVKNNAWELSDCIDEIRLLYLLSHNNITKLVEGVDLDKLAYLKKLVNSPLVDYYKVNTEKAKLLSSIMKLSESCTVSDLFPSENSIDGRLSESSEYINKLQSRINELESQLSDYEDSINTQKVLISELMSSNNTTDTDSIIDDTENIELVVQNSGRRLIVDTETLIYLKEYIDNADLMGDADSLNVDKVGKLFDSLLTIEGLRNYLEGKITPLELSNAIKQI